jgi:putative flavoprotein involved in K+ transport
VGDDEDFVCGVPRRYRGRDINDWFTRMGMFDTEVGELKSPRAKFEPHPQISGKNGGESLNLHRFARDGVVLLGHVRGAQGGRLDDRTGYEADAGASGPI